MRLISLLIFLASTLAAQIPAIDWNKQKAETLQHYRALVQIDTSSPQDYAKLVRSEVERWAKVVKAANLKID